MDPQSADFLLRRNWFLSDDDIYEFLETLNESTYNYVYNNRKAYHDNIQRCIEPHDFVHYPKKQKLKVVEVSDVDMFRVRKQHLDKSAMALQSEWNEFKKRNNIVCPVSPHKEELDALTQKYETATKQLEEYKRNKYSNDLVKDLEKMIFHLENELKIVKYMVVTDNELWDSSAKLDWINGEM
jgi:hypothetical protein